METKMVTKKTTTASKAPTTASKAPTTASKAPTTAKAKQAAAKAARVKDEIAEIIASKTEAIENSHKARAKAGEGDKAVYVGVASERSQLAPAKRLGELECKVLKLICKGIIPRSETYTKKQLKALYQEHAGYKTEQSANAGVDRTSPPRGRVWDKKENVYTLNEKTLKEYLEAIG
jgi:hypothetical protein